MTTLLQRRIGFVAGLLSVFLLTARPAFASSTDKDIAEMKTNLASVQVQLQTLLGYAAALDRKQDATSNTFQGELTTLQSSVKSAGETRSNPDPGVAARQAQFAASLQNLSNTVGQLAVLVADLKSAGKAVDYKNEVGRQLQGFAAQIASVTNALLNSRSPGVDPVTKSNIVYIAEISSRSAGAKPGWPEFALLGMGAASVVLMLIVLLTFGAKLTATQRSMTDAQKKIAGLVLQVEGRVTQMEGGNTAIQATGEKVIAFLGQVENRRPKPPRHTDQEDQFLAIDGTRRRHGVVEDGDEPVARRDRHAPKNHHADGIGRETIPRRDPEKIRPVAPRNEDRHATLARRIAAPDAAVHGRVAADHAQVDRGFRGADA